MKNILKGLLVILVITACVKVSNDLVLDQQAENRELLSTLETEVLNQEQPQTEYTKEDYNSYIKYKNSLIQEYGEEVYNLMNQEAGIKTEAESFNHFMEYGI